MVKIADTSYTLSGVSGEVKSSTSLNNNEGINTFGASAAAERDVFIIARAFLNIAPMTHKKLQKLCYYAKAWYLALYDENLIHDHFEAWVHGAVQPHLYDAYKKHGYRSIPQCFDGLIPEEFNSFAREIYDAYGHLSGDELETINHTETPWINARKGLKPWEPSNNVISEEEMKKFYRKMIANDSETEKKEFE